MKHAPVVAALALVLAGGLPALADEPVLAPCKPVPRTAVLTPGGSSESFLGPLLPANSKASVLLTDQVATETYRSVVVDLAGLPVGTTAVLQARLSWTLAPNDFDLHLRDAKATGSVPGRPEALAESAALPVRHCAQVTVSMLNRRAVADEITIDLGLVPA